MTSLPQRGAAPPSDSPSLSPSSHSGDAAAASSSSPAPEQNSGPKQCKASLLSSVLAVFDPDQGSSSSPSSASSSAGSRLPAHASVSHAWSRVLRRIVGDGSMWRLLGCARALTDADVWFLGKCYKLSSPPEEPSGDSDSEHAMFLEDFSSRIWITYRKGFDAISDPKSKLTTDVNWGCMVRSSQMLVAQALIFHHLGRSWRKPSQNPCNPEYIRILHLFGDSEACAFSIHNLLEAGKSYGLAAGSWVGPYAMCRAWQTLVRTSRERPEAVDRNENFPMALYVVSGDEDGERGGAPVVCIDAAAQLCYDFNKDQSTWSPILLLVPLVLGLDKINPRYIPLLKETFTFPQSLGILGGKPGASTYIAGVQDDRALYLDPHETQLAVNIASDNLEADTSSYHCSTIRDMALDLLDPSLAIGFYCHDKDDFDDFCSRASELAEKANGAPLFTVVQSVQPLKQMYDQHDGSGCSGGAMADNIDVEDLDGSGETGEDEWQIL
ncbi:cysteine protease ATG4B-like [Lolium rigidum]|uniref:cysteine protease ATG4B-like n=1 Tax=Lolium rigidum TaxID=89674 RepID=UPI001F5D766A|nr:cysteine protease ATG4B-like [Lolium rigidum]